MKRPRWQAPGEHPDHNLVLTYLEGELDENDSSDVAQHLRTCWDCRAFSEQIKRGILSFVEYHKECFLPDLPPPPTGWNNFRVLLNRISAESGNHSSERFGFLRVSALRKAATSAWSSFRIGVPRPAWISASISVVTALALLHFYVLEPPQIEAAEFLRRAEAATLTNDHPGAIVSQRVRIQRGSAVFEQVTTRDAQLPTKRTSRTIPDLAIKSAMSLVDMDAQAPLSADGFAGWRDGIEQKDDRIFESREAVMLQTTPLHSESELVRYASITVNRADWRPIAEHVEYRNQPPLDVKEISFDVHESPSSRDTRSPATAQAARPASMPNMLEKELAVRSALHRVGADLGEAVEIRATPGEASIAVSGVVDSVERKQELLAALRGFHNVAASVRTESEVALRELPSPVLHAPPLIVTTRSPLEKQLLEHFGDSEAAENFSKDAISLTGDLMTRAWALRHLSERYGGRGSKQEVQLNAASRQVLLAMRRDHYRAMLESTSQLSELLQPVLGPIAQPVPVSTDKLPLFASTQKAQRLTLEVLSGSGPADANETNEVAHVAGDLLATLRNLEITLRDQP